MNSTKKSDLKNIVCIVAISFIALALFHNIIGTSIFGGSSWNSYSLQAKSWLEGRLDIDCKQHLELGVYEGKYYVTFPPLPSLFMLPFVILFGTSTPDNTIIFLICICTVITVYLLLRRLGSSELSSSFISVFYVFGSNMLFMCINGGVWFLAQALNMLLCTLAVNFYTQDKRLASFLCLALAVGCRPFSAIYIIAFLVLYILNDIRTKTFSKATVVSKYIVPLVPVAVVAACLMTFNIVRFGNPFEFGHNYLPEFTEAENGQFSIAYLASNLKQLFFGPIDVDWSLNISYSHFNGFCLFVANPIYSIAVYRVIKGLKHGTLCKTHAVLFFAVFANIIALCLHKTLGGWQFGARYTCDMIPFVFMALLFVRSNKETVICPEEVVASEKESTPKDAPSNAETSQATVMRANNADKHKYAPSKTTAESIGMKDRTHALTFDRLEIVIALFGIMFNLFGALELWLGL